MSKNESMACIRSMHCLDNIEYMLNLHIYATVQVILMK